MESPKLHLIRRKLANLRSSLPEQAAALVIAFILARTRAGRDAAGRTFAPYSREYLKRKRHPGVGGSLPERMIWRLKGEGQGRIEFAGRIGKLTANQLAEIHVRGLGNMPRRDFAGWRHDSKEAQELRRELIRQVRRMLNPGGGYGLYG
jgi:hypothetical protein